MAQRKGKILIIITFSAIFLIINQYSNLWSQFYLRNSNTNLDKIYTLTKDKPKEDLKIETENPIIETSTERTKNYDKYRIDTKGCKIHNRPLFDEEIKLLYKNMTNGRIKCESRRPQIKIQRVNYTWVQLNWSELNHTPYCYISELKFGANDDNFIFGEISGPIKPLINLPDYQIVRIFCYRNFTKFNEKDFKRSGFITPNGLIHEEYVPLIQQFEHVKPENSIPNILLVAIDSVSYLSFERNFPRMKKFVRDHNFYELKGYTSVGENTWPNMIPFFTGFFADELLSELKRGKMYFDNWPLIWKRFKNKGFRTLFTEEMSKYGLFNYKKKGFIHKPFDYYLRPFTVKIQTYKYLEFCYNGKLETEYYYDYFHDFAKAMRDRNEKYFAYVSVSEISHDDFNYAAFVDSPTHKLMSNLFKDNLMDDTIVIFFSDHGIRIGPIRKTHSGVIESHLPFIFIHLPNNIVEEHKYNLNINQYRLTSHFDIHSTLMHILNGKVNHSLPHGMSLFEEIGEDRNCISASIPEHFCSCLEDIEVDNLRVVQPHALKIVDKVNSLTDSLRSKCISFQFDSIHAAYERIISSGGDIKLGNVTEKTYLMQVYMKPGNALFESTVKSYDNKHFDIYGNIARINQYGNQSHCIHNSFLEKYCFCKDMLQV